METTLVDWGYLGDDGKETETTFQYGLSLSSLVKECAPA